MSVFVASMCLASHASTLPVDGRAIAYGACQCRKPLFPEGRRGCAATISSHMRFPCRRRGEGVGPAFAAGSHSAMKVPILEDETPFPCLRGEGWGEGRTRKGDDGEFT